MDGNFYKYKIEIGLRSAEALVFFSINEEENENEDKTITKLKR